MINRTTPKIVYLLGYAGLVPFVAGAFLAWFDKPFDPFFVFHFFIIYSVVILAFICGSWWGFAVSMEEAWPRNMLLIGSNVLLLLLWLLLVFSQNRWTVVMLGIGYVLLYAGETLVRSFPVDSGYRGMRLILSVTVILCHGSIFLAMS